jgi:hypothetical protein
VVTHLTTNPPVRCLNRAERMEDRKHVRDCIVILVINKPDPRLTTACLQLSDRRCASP